MPKKKREEESPKKQFERFVETARQLDISSDDKEVVERTFKKLSKGARQRKKG